MKKKATYIFVYNVKLNKNNPERYLQLAQNIKDNNIRSNSNDSDSSK